MGAIFGLNFESKEERERKFKEYTKKIFPYGEAQKDKVTELLLQLLPREKKQSLMMYYIQVKEKIVDGENIGYKEAAESLNKYAILVKRTPQLDACVRAVMEADLHIGEELDYPDAEQMRQMIDQWYTH